MAIMALDTLLFDEIHAVIHAMLGQRFPKELFWTSVGLLADDNKLRWKSHVNAGCDHAPCKVPLPCRVKNGYMVPPCLLERIESLCDFRQKLSDLERTTMSHDSFSMGDVSIRYFLQGKGQPYISLIQHKDYPWIKTKQELTNDLQLESAQSESANARQYKELAQACMPTGTTAALVPLVQYHQGKLEYIGAIVLCALTNSQIWAHLPRIKSNAIALAEPHRHIFRLSTDRSQNMMNRLISILLEDDYLPPSNLFEGTCTVTNCDIHVRHDDKDRHNKDCRLLGLAKANDLFDTSNIDVQKSLFHYKEADLRESKKTQSHSCLAATFVDLDKNLKLFDEKLQLGDSCEKIAWPTKPGLVSLLSIANVYSQLKSHQVDAVKTIMLEAYKVNVQQVISFVFKLSDRDGIRNLAISFAGHASRTGNTAKALRACIYGELYSIADLHRATNFQQEISDKMFGRSEVPVMYPFFDAKNSQLRLEWMITPEQKSPSV